MGLLTIIRKNKAKAREMRVLFLGLDNAGKTTILKRVTGGDIKSVSPTLGFNIMSLVRGEYTLNVWDVGGQRTLRPYWRNYFESTDAVVWVVDSSDALRMGDGAAELRALLSEERLAGATLLVFANKQDLEGSLGVDEIRDALGLDTIDSHKWRIVPCSAITGAGLDDGLDWVVGEVAGRLYWSGRRDAGGSAGTEADAAVDVAGTVPPLAGASATGTNTAPPSVPAVAAAAPVH